MDTFEKLEYKIKAGIKEASIEKEMRLKDRIELPIEGLHGEKIYVTGYSELERKVQNIKALYENVPENYRVATVVLLDAHSSATIEGAHTTVERMKECLELPESKDEIMVANTYKGCMYAYEHPITSDNIRLLWNIIVDGVCENTDKAGVLYRDGMVVIGDTERVVHTPADASLIPELMRRLFAFGTESTLDAIIKSFIFHFYFVYVHPFCDGNGRTARTITSSQLFHAGYEKMKSIAMATAINRELASYYKNITACEKVIDERKKSKWMDLSPFIDYMLDILEDSLTNAMLANNELNDTERKLLDRMNSVGINAEITVKKAMTITKLSENMTRNILNELGNKGYLRISKETKPYIYRLTPHM